MSIDNRVKTGPNFVPSYQTSGVPYVTSSAADDEIPSYTDVSPTIRPLKVTFPFVTRFFQISNTGNQMLRIGFSDAGVIGATEVDGAGNRTENNFFLLPASTVSARLEIRCTSIHLLSNGTSGNGTGYSLIAGLTGITGSNFPVISGSNGFDGVG